MNSKPIWYSKTFWLSVAVALIPVVQQIYGDPFITSHPWLFSALGLLLMFLRVVTTGPVRLMALAFVLCVCSPAQAQQPLPGRVQLHRTYQLPYGSIPVIRERRGPLGFLWSRKTDVYLPPQPLPGWGGQQQ